MLPSSDLVLRVDFGFWIVPTTFSRGLETLLVFGHRSSVRVKVLPISITPNPPKEHRAPHSPSDPTNAATWYDNGLLGYLT